MKGQPRVLVKRSLLYIDSRTWQASQKQSSRLFPWNFCHRTLNSSRFLETSGSWAAPAQLLEQKCRNKGEHVNRYVTKWPQITPTLSEPFFDDGATWLQVGSEWWMWSCSSTLEVELLLIAAECFHHVAPIRGPPPSTHRNCLQIKMHFRQLFLRRRAEWRDCIKSYRLFTHRQLEIVKRKKKVPDRK